MASISPEQDPARYFGFSDLHGFKDFVGYVILCAPDMFPHDDWREPDQQIDLDRAFSGLRYGLKIVAQERGESEALSGCRQLVEKAYSEYRDGRDAQGQRFLEDVDKLLKKMPSQ